MTTHNPLHRLGVALLAGTLLAAVGQAVAQPSLDLLVNGKAIVRLVPGTDVTAFHATFQTTTLAVIPSRDIYHVQIPQQTDPFAFKAAAEADPRVLWVELNYYGQAPEARGRCFYWNVTPQSNAYFAQPAWNQIQMDTAQQLSTGAATIVAIVDGGIDATHPALIGRAVSAGWNFVDSNANTADVGNGIDDDGDGEIDEMVGHGTHVAGIVARVALDTQLLPVKVLNSDGTSDNFIVAAGIFYAIDQGASVINVSLGSTYNSDAVNAAVQEAQAKGIPVIAAAGNVDVITPLEYPANNAGVVGVASVDEADVKSFFSNYGANVTLAAPGSAVVSTLPGAQYANWNGTSMSAPMVAATAAMILARHPDWPADSRRANNVRLALQQGADPIDAQNPTYAGLLGAGRLNAAQALMSFDSFAATGIVIVGIGPEGVTIADVNGDSRADVIATSAGASTVSVMISTALRDLSPPIVYGVPAGPLGVVAEDLDGDGHRDLAVACSGANVVAVLHNNGDGTFAAPMTYGAGVSPRALVAAQLVDSPALDLAVASEESDAVVILRNTGSGFIVQQSVPVGQKPNDVIATDIDDDGDLDVLSADRRGNQVSVLLNSAGTFVRIAQVVVGEGPRGLTAGDFDGDGDPDIVTANKDGNSLSVLRNVGGSFSLAGTLPLAPGRQPYKLATLDANCDGDLDFFVSNSDDVGSAASLLLGRGDLTFLRAIDFAVGADPQGVATGDLDGDGDADVAVACTLADTIHVLTNLGCDNVRKGDLNCDGVVNFADINAFVTALGGPVAYSTAYPDCRWENADCNDDTLVNFKDINAFVALLGS